MEVPPPAVGSPHMAKGPRQLELFSNLSGGACPIRQDLALAIGGEALTYRPEARVQAQ